MFKEFNVKFEDAEIIGGADNLLEGTGVTKVILRGDNKLSSLDSTFKNCSQLDTVDGELDLNGISDIDSLLEGSNLVTSIDLKNVNNKDITANNAFSHVNQINIGGETYNKEAIQNIISSREWTFNNINYIDTVGEDVVTHTPNISEEDENTQIVINDALEQKARNVEIKGQTYQNLIQGKEGAELLADIKFESIDGSPSELETPIDNPVCVEVIEGQTYQNLIEGKGEYNLTDTCNVFLPLGLQANKDYTLQLDSVGKDDKPITVNLGGSEITIQPVNDTSTHHKVVIKTPSTLTSDKLELSGEGVVVNDVMLFEGGEDVIKQDVDYIEGIQSIGERVENVFDKSLYYDMVTNYEKNIENNYCRTIQLKPYTVYTIYSYYTTNLDIFRICTTPTPNNNIVSRSDYINQTQKFTFKTDSTGKIYAFIAYYTDTQNLKNSLDTAKIHIQEGSSFVGYIDYGVPMYQIDIRTSNNYEKLWREL